MRRMLVARGAVLLILHTTGVKRLVFLGGIVSILTVGTF
jgi:hypothetical protein